MTQLTSELAAWVSDAVGGTVTATRQIPAGGRRGWFVDVRLADGQVDELFLQLGRDAAGLDTFHGFDVEAQVMTALGEIGVRVPRVRAYDQQRGTLLVERVPGRVWFQPPRDAGEQVSVAQDFVRQLALWHRTPAEQLELPALGPVKSWREHQHDSLDVAATMVAAVDDVDPLITFTLDWLRANVPDADGPVVLLQGDTGPGNFLYADGRVTGVIDWELAHLGDPMDDIAWLSWRATQHGFPDFPARLREYEEQSGIAVDPARVRYYQLNAFSRLGPHFAVAEMGLASHRLDADSAAVDGDRSADGSLMIMALLHRRMRLEALSRAVGLPVPPREVEEAPPKRYGRMYDRVLDQLQTMVGSTDDRTVASTGKAVARQVKHLKELDRNGQLFDTAELDHIGRLLGRPVAEQAEARRALVTAVREGRVSMADYVDYHWQRLRRDDHLMRLASGALYERSWPALR